MNKRRILVTTLTSSLTALGIWIAAEGYSSTAIIPTKGDVPTIGHGSTRYEDGTRVKMGDTITRVRAAELALNLMNQDCKVMAASMPGVLITQEEFDAYCDFVGQYGNGNWSQSSMRRHLFAGQPIQACHSLLKYRFAAGYDCSTLVNGKPNKRCYGVWTRQQERHQACLAGVQ